MIMSMRMTNRALIGIALLACAGACKKSRPANELVFSDDAGRRLTRADLAGASGTVHWEIIGGDNVPAEAKQLHEQGRAAGSAADYVKALALFEQASKLAPAWPYPRYDAAYTYLLQGDTVGAEAAYKEVDRLAPRGFFTSKTTLDCLRRERTGELIPDFCRLFTMTEWLSPEERRTALRGLVEKAPDFGAGWHELSEALEGDDAARAEAIEKGLAARSDAQTRGLLRINKALLIQDTDRAGAIRILGEVATDPASTLDVEQIAKATLAQLIGT
jgi:tetratricopeptide (TPR) repeat protein